MTDRHHTSKDLADEAFAKWLRHSPLHLRGDFAAFHAGFAAGRGSLETRAIALPITCGWPACGCSAQTNCLIEAFNQRSTNHVVNPVDADAGAGTESGATGRGRTALSESVDLGPRWEKCE